MTVSSIPRTARVFGQLLTGTRKIRVPPVEGAAGVADLRELLRVKLLFSGGASAEVT
jgi:hypothetical protein